MRRIGLIGGMSWESTATYYRMINEEVRERCGGLASADLVMHSLDFSRVVALQKADRWDEAGELLGQAGARLAAAGAESVLICTNTMHLVAGAVARRSGVPLIDIIDETAAALKADGQRRPLLLATRYTMEHGFYAERMRRHGIEVVVPESADRARVHEVIFDELCRGTVRAGSRRDFEDIVGRSAARGVDSVILGCTEISLLVGVGDFAMPGYDTTAIHARAAVRFMLKDRAIDRAA
ncbi:aspartate/glutamate racemase family protein [Fulvimarina endophytica]|uniref:Aspartate/glutamate racemase family protein n=1 Tax=Fulvimarina endophytica TaxID=2293836 RepID=A0A371X4A1_9HYPH|nr:aspartate/glutamate racemase family protein [Fulvimarina endophytica]RFC64029.1 aspartate/glutamate racemase family protein [Fulvimarina endophytica]